MTAIAGDPQTNLDFVTGVLGLRLVKLTVNFDDPGTYHFYFGDELGRPGTILTFFPWPGGRRGVRGTGQATVTSFSVPAGSMGFWRDRLSAKGVVDEEQETRFDEEVLTFLDPDGLQLELVAQDGANDVGPWSAGTVPAAHAIRGFHGVTLMEMSAEVTASFLTEAMGFDLVAEEGRRTRFRASQAAMGNVIDVLDSPEAEPGRIAAGTVHHVAWRVAGDGEQLDWQAELGRSGVSVTPVQDRQYFHSIYFREPGGVLFEIATDPPGFTLDESPDELGTALKLPPWLMPRRRQIEESLPRVELPQLVGSGE